MIYLFLFLIISHLIHLFELISAPEDYSLRRLNLFSCYSFQPNAPNLVLVTLLQGLDVLLHIHGIFELFSLDHHLSLV